MVATVGIPSTSKLNLHKHLGNSYINTEDRMMQITATACDYVVCACCMCMYGYSYAETTYIVS